VNEVHQAAVQLLVEGQMACRRVHRRQWVAGLLRLVQLVHDLALPRPAEIVAGVFSRYVGSFSSSIRRSFCSAW